MPDRTNLIADDDHQGKAVARVASAWKWDPELERLIADPATLDRLPARYRVMVGHYATSKQAARSLGVDVAGPTAPSTTDPKGTS